MTSGGCRASIGERLSPNKPRPGLPYRARIAPRTPAVTRRSSSRSASPERGAARRCWTRKGAVMRREQARPCERDPVPAALVVEDNLLVLELMADVLAQ